MEQLAARDLRQLLSTGSEPSAPHISIYFPFGVSPEERESARVRLSRLVSRAESLLLRHYPQITSRFLRPLKGLAERLTKLAPAKGLAVFCSPQRMAYMPLERPVSEMAIVANSFHVKPLLPLAAGEETFFVLVLEPFLARVFAGNRDGLDELEAFRAVAGLAGDKIVSYRPRLSSGTRIGAQRTGLIGPRDLSAFFHDIDRRLKKIVGRKRTPIILVGESDAIARYRALSKVRTITADDIVLSGSESYKISDLHRLTWPIASQTVVCKNRRLNRAYKLSRLRGQVLENLQDVALAVHEGRVESLFLDSSVQIWGHLDQNGSVHLTRGVGEKPCDDLLDDLAERVLAAGGKVHVLDPKAMPANRAAVAVLRPR
jgi:hypothetical protein